MDTISAIKTRILRLCAERNITINKLATMSALPPSSISSNPILRGARLPAGEETAEGAGGVMDRSVSLFSVLFISVLLGAEIPHS